MTSSECVTPHNQTMKQPLMNTARFYPRKTRFMPDSAARTSCDLSAHSATTSATESRRSRRKHDRNHEIAALQSTTRKQPKLPKADTPTPARHISTASSCSRSYPVACHRLCNALTTFGIGMLLWCPDSSQQFPLLLLPVPTRFHRYSHAIAPVMHHLLRITSRCALYFV